MFYVRFLIYYSTKINANLHAQYTSTKFVNPYAYIWNKQTEYE